MTTSTTLLSTRLRAWAASHGAAPISRWSSSEVQAAARDLGVSVVDVHAARQAILDSAITAVEAGRDLAPGPGPGPVHVRREPGPQLKALGFTGNDDARVGGVTPPPTESVERVLPGLEALVDSASTVPFRRRAWEALSVDERASLGVLGHDASSWNAVRDGRVDRLPQPMRARFAELTPSQRGAVVSLGYTPELWDAERATLRDIVANEDILRAFTALLAEAEPITAHAIKERLLPQARDWGVETTDEKRALLYLTDFHGHRFTPDARRAIRDDVLRHTALDQAAGGFKRLGNNGGPVVNDAGGLEPTLVTQVVDVQSPDDVRRAIGQARLLGLKVSIAGRRHSEGGQSVSAGSINLDMMGLNRVELRPNGTMRVEAGATWAQVQDVLARSGRAVKVMQTSNIFTVGGSLSVNCHGRTPGEPPLISTVRSVRVMTADGEIKTCSREENAELFHHVIGGYGGFGVILDAELDTVPDSQCRMDVELLAERDYPARFAEALKDPAVEHAYGRLDPNLKGEVLLHVVRRVGEADASAPRDGANIESGAMAAINKLAFHGSKLGPHFLEARWAVEKWMKKDGSTATRNDFMSPNIEFLNNYWFDEGKHADILQEYYVPRERFQAFADGLREVQRRHGLASLNVTIRDVGKDTESALPYARQDAFSFVLYYNQELSAESREQHARLTRDLVDLAIRCGGTFYLPYQRDYTREQLRAAYPGIDAFFAARARHDPDGVFSNKWLETYGPR
ncbi:MAG: FAD-binding oxidoreductase [Myxococcota bacterium]